MSSVIRAHGATVLLEREYLIDLSMISIIPSAK
jgi:hypothetical protein